MLPCRSHELQQATPQPSLHEAMSMYLQAAIQDAFCMPDLPSLGTNAHLAIGTSIEAPFKLNAVVSSDLLLLPHRTRFALQFDKSIGELAAKLVVLWQVRPTPNVAMRCLASHT